MHMLETAKKALLTRLLVNFLAVFGSVCEESFFPESWLNLIWPCYFSQLSQLLLASCLSSMGGRKVSPPPPLLHHVELQNYRGFSQLKEKMLIYRSSSAPLVQLQKLWFLPSDEFVVKRSHGGCGYPFVLHYFLRYFSRRISLWIVCNPRRVIQLCILRGSEWALRLLW